MAIWDELQPVTAPAANRAQRRGEPVARGYTPDAQTTAAAGSITDPIAYIQQRQAQLPPNAQSIEQIYQELKAAGIPVERPTHAGGTKTSADKLVINGAVYDFIGGVDGPDARWTGAQPAGFWKDGQAYDDPNYQIRSSGSGAGGGMLPPGYATGYGTGGGQYPLFSAQGPGLAAPFNAAFQPPSGTDDPGFAFAMGEAQKVIERSAAAKGTLLTAGTLKDLASYSTGMARQGYGDAWNRSRTQYNDAFNVFNTNNNNLYNRLGGLAQTGYGAAAQYGQNQTNQANANAASTVAGSNATNQGIGALVQQIPAGIDAFNDWRKNRQNQQAGA